MESESKKGKIDHQADDIIKSGNERSCSQCGIHLHFFE